MKKTILLLASLALLPSLLAAPIKQVLRKQGKFVEFSTDNIKWAAWEEGFKETPEGLLCDNGTNDKARRGVGKNVFLNQKQPCAIKVSARSRAENVSGTMDREYSIYVDLTYDDDTNLWAQAANFSTGTHDWEERIVLIMPEKPIKRAACWMLFRNHTGKAYFKDFKIYQTPPEAGGGIFDSVPVTAAQPFNGFQLRDVKADSDFHSFDNGTALGVSIKTKESTLNGKAKIIEATIQDNKKDGDRILHLVYSQLLPKENWQWTSMSRKAESIKRNEYTASASFGSGCGINGRMSRYPFAAVTTEKTGKALGMDLYTPAFGRCGFNSINNELFVAWDIALTPEKPSATIKIVSFDFEPDWGMRSAFAKLYEIYPEAFTVRIKKQGLWMPFAPISKVEGWQDFGFAIKEGIDETAWDDANGILTFRYTEPMTWWMSMPKDMPRTMEAALERAKQLTTHKNQYVQNRAKALFTSGHKDENGNYIALLRNAPWCNGAVWSLNSMPGIKGEFTDYKNKWNEEIAEKYYGEKAKGNLDGEYVDSSEGYVTAMMDNSREHFPHTDTPLTFDKTYLKPGIFRGLIAFEYVRALDKEMRSRNKLMMANSTPANLWWLAPMLDVMGIETNWNTRKKWTPPNDDALIWRRAMCGPKLYCFLQNTDFNFFTHEMAEKYMKRSLFYAMFPGFFSANASSDQYFKNPELYNRDRPLFKKYVPLCKLVAEAGWKPVTLAKSNAPEILVERYGDNLFTVFNNGKEKTTASIHFTKTPAAVKELVEGRKLTLTGNNVSLELEPEDVAIIRVE